MTDYLPTLLKDGGGCSLSYSDQPPLVLAQEPEIQGLFAVLLQKGFVIKVGNLADEDDELDIGRGVPLAECPPFNYLEIHRLSIEAG